LERRINLDHGRLVPLSNCYTIDEQGWSNYWEAQVILCIQVQPPLSCFQIDSESTCFSFLPALFNCLNRTCRFVRHLLHCRNHYSTFFIAASTTVATPVLNRQAQWFIL
jgi:hypothetical protein